MIALVTGAAGFVGSHLVDHLLEHGDTVRAIDCFTPYYEQSEKQRNLGHLVDRRDFTFERVDLSRDDLATLLTGVDVVYHLAGQPGVRPSWGSEFGAYVRHNIEATQRLLEAAADASLASFVFASSSSIYGDAERLPTPETVRPEPVSPYGVTKLAAEHLCGVYRRNMGVPTASLRLFTVYGPRQRPDMAFRRLVHAAVHGSRFELYGDGEQTRDFTYVGDVVTAMRAAADSGWTGVANIGGGARVSMAEAVSIVASLCGEIDIVRGRPQAGDVRHTGADTTAAVRGFGYAPKTGVAEGLARMVEWERASSLVA
ncbi:MAG TPA: NAD-dependent epimerase/dehydratase family protein [Actinomycetota bacterium]|nr:NAD-dependent epimerase/dehydratase family protein [Actinomycetota bacterium]